MCFMGCRRAYTPADIPYFLYVTLGIKPGKTG
jgi:hypothetical protein